VSDDVIFVDAQLSSDCSGTYSITNRDCSGSDGDAYNTPQEAANIVEPGDTVYFRGGVYKDMVRDHDIPTMIITRSGSVGNPITFMNYNNETVIISGADVDGDPYKDIVIRLGVPPADADNASGSGVSYVTIYGLIVEESTTYGILICGGSDRVDYPPTYPSQYVTISHVTARNVINVVYGPGYGKGISSKGTVLNSVIEYCEAYGNNGNGIEWGWIQKNFDGDTTVPSLPYSDDDKMSTAHNCAIRNCLSHDNFDPAYGGDTDGMSLHMAYQTIVEDNVIYNNGDDGLDLYGSIECIARRNIIFGHPAVITGNGAGLKFSAGGGGRHQILENIAYDNAGYNFEGSDSNHRYRWYYPSRIIHNIAVDGRRGFNYGYSFNYFPVGYELEYFRNNIGLRNIDNGASRDWRASALTAVDSNYNYMSAANLATNQAAGIDLNSYSGTDPNFADDNPVINTDFLPNWTIEQKLEHIRSQVRTVFNLNESSQLIDAGTIIPGYHCATSGAHPGENCREWYGDAPDIGAYEYSEGVGATSVSPGFLKTFFTGDIIRKIIEFF
ncbi:MAG: right-handed parallel beta-helix repeat-containing protein, partial [Candidatus Pacearchaeota archaeon]